MPPGFQRLEARGGALHGVDGPPQELEFLPQALGLLELPLQFFPPVLAELALFAEQEALFAQEKRSEAHFQELLPVRRTVGDGGVAVVVATHLWVSFLGIRRRRSPAGLSPGS